MVAAPTGAGCCGVGPVLWYGQPLRVSRDQAPARAHDLRNREGARVETCVEVWQRTHSVSRLARDEEAAGKSSSQEGSIATTSIFRTTRAASSEAARFLFLNENLLVQKRKPRTWAGLGYT